MKKLFSTLMLTAAALCAPAVSVADSFYGFTPHECDDAELNAFGSGANAFLETAIRLDPGIDPLVASLKGHKILGVRFFLRADYKQKNKGFSCIKVFKGDLNSTPVSKKENFLAGWNEIYFDEPIEIGDEPLFVGYQVYETQGVPYPVAIWKNGRIENVAYARAGKDNWADCSYRGLPMVEAITDAEPSILDNHIIAAPFEVPVVAPTNGEFNCRLYLHNQGAEPIESLVYTCFDGNGSAIASYPLTLTEPLAPYDSHVASVKLHAPDSEGENIPVSVSVTSVNGKDSPSNFLSSCLLYVTDDVFQRVPLIEEFTGLTCTNCPFMFYYLDVALEQFNAPHVYVAHHSGFQDDALTQPCDGQLLYLFDGNSFNPAAMFDRRVAEGETSPIMKASEPSEEPYLQRIENAMKYPALAKVLVDSEITADGAKCRVYGKISKGALDNTDNIYVTAYLLEDGLSMRRYPQMGLDPLPEGCPDDLLERFRHTGVIRHDFCGGSNGQKLEIDADGNFDVSFTLDKIGDMWKIENCEIVAFVHKVNTENRAENYVLNAGAMRFNNYADGAGVNLIEADGSRPADMRIFDLMGRRVINPLPGTIYIQNGRKVIFTR